MRRMSPAEAIFSVFNVSFMVFLVVVTLYPFLHTIFASLSNPMRLLSHQGLLFHPLGFSLEAYGMVFKNPMLLRGYFNTLFYVALGTCLNLLMSSLGAYALSRKGFKLKGAITLFVVFTMFFSGGLVPFYLAVRQFGLIDSRLALILPTAINTYNLIIMRTSFASIPESLEESARIDGANDYVILFRIIIPLSKAVLAVMVLFYGVSHWNSWFNAMIFLRERLLYPLQLILREILVSNSTDSMTTSVMSGDKEQVGETIKYATIVVATLPILMIYPFLQKYFVKGVMVGALKE